MATLAATGSASDENNSTTVDVTLTLTAGSVIQIVGKWEGANGATPTVAKTDGSNPFTLRPVKDHSNGDLHLVTGYLLTHTMSGSTTLRLTLSAARPYKRFLVIEHTHSGTAVFDVSATAEDDGSGSDATVNSGNVTTTGTEEICIGAYGEYSGNTTSAEQINGVNADGKVTASFATAWHRVVGATFTGAATATVAGSNHVEGIQAVKITAGAPATERHQTRRLMQAGGFF